MTPSPFQSFEQASALIHNGDVIVTAMAACEPQVFYQNSLQLCQNRQNLTIYCANPSRSYEVFTDDSLEGRVEIRPMFLTENIRYHQTKSHVHYIPQHLSQWTANIKQGKPVDVFWGCCSLPDPRGFVSIGPSNCYEFEVIRHARNVVLEVNPQIPFTYGATCISLDNVTALLQADYPLPTYRSPAPDRIDQLIAAHVAKLVPDGATIQLGIGSIPNAIAHELRTKEDLGVHTEMINDAILQLMQVGTINGRQKTLWPEKVVGAFAYGSEELYRFLDHNPFIEFHPASVVNDSYRIGRNHRMISINSAVEVDITGQVCSESIGHLELSGVGGATDTHLGAQRSEGGRGIIALKSITKSGHPKIVFELQPGAKVSISRNDVDTIVTENGVAELKGQTVAERARRLIAIAHPSTQEQLYRLSKEHGYI